MRCDFVRDVGAGAGVEALMCQQPFAEWSVRFVVEHVREVRTWKGRSGVAVLAGVSVALLLPQNDCSLPEIRVTAN